MFISRVKANSLPTKFPTRDVLEVIAQRPLREQSSLEYPKKVVESMTQRKLGPANYFFDSPKCIDALSKISEDFKKVVDDSKTFFTRKTKMPEAIEWANKQIEKLGKEVEVPQIGEPLKKINN